MRRLSLFVRTVILLAGVAVAAAVTLNAQSSLGALRGAVKDAQGVIPGAAVQLVNEANGTQRETVTNEVGEYSFPAVQPGAYTLLVSMPSYTKYERKGLRIGTQENLSIDVGLDVGGLQETVAVTAAAPLLETTNASTGATLDAKELESIPSPGRSVFLMANLQPTVQASGNAHYNRMQDQSGNSTMSIGGGPVQGNNYLVDGFPVTDLANRASTNPSIEAIEDMKVQVHTYDAETGRTGGGVMNMSAKSGANQFHGGIYGVYRPTSMVGQLLIPKVSGLANNPEVWRDGGGGVGGPIFKNKTFFWVATESYIDKQPVANSTTVPTTAEISGNFQGVLSKGAQVTIKDPLTGLAFPGNVIPANRINPVSAKLLSYYQPATTQVDNGSPNLVQNDLIPNKAFQGTTKIDQHFNDSVALSGFVLRQVTHEASSNYNSAYDFVGSSYQLDRSINTVVINNTYVVNPSTVLMVRGGYNKFNDNYYLNDRNGNPLSFNVSQLSQSALGAGGWPQSLIDTMSDTQRYPNISMTGYKGTGWTARQANGYYQYGANAALTKLAGVHSLKFGADWRTLGVKSLNYGSSTGTYSFTGTYSGNAIADMLLGYPASGSVPLNSTENGSVNYFSAFAQDDLRLGKLTLNYGVRLERETGLGEKNNQISVNFDQTAVNPLNKDLTFTDPATGQPRQILGGLIFAGVNGAPTVQGNQPAVKVAPRVGAVYSLNEKTVIRSGWGLYFVPYSYPSAGTTSWGQIGYSATTNIQQTTVPTVTMSNPFPAGLVQPTGNSLGLLTGEGGDITFIDPSKGAPRVYQYSTDIQRELPGGVTASVGYTGLTGRNLSWSGTININQLDPKYLTSGLNTLSSVPNPFYGIADAGQFAASKTIQLGQLLRPFPEFGNVNMTQSTGARSQYNALIVSLRKRASGLWGGSFSYTYSRLDDNQFGQGNYYSSGAGLQNNYEVVPGSAYYNPDDLYGRSLLDSPHKIVISPTINLPFGEGRHWLNHGGVVAAVLGGWSLNLSTTLQSGFPIGVTQQVTTTNGNNFLFGGTVRPNIVDGATFVVPDLTDRIANSVNGTNNQYLNPAAFTLSAANQYGNEPRLLPGAYSPWRNNTDLGVNKRVGLPWRTSATLRLEVLNLFDQVQWASPSTTFGSSTFGQVTSQANNARMVQFTVRYQF